MTPTPTSPTSTSSHPTLSEIGKALAISSRRVSQLRIEGMPVTSIEAATAWRERQRTAKDGDSSERLRLARIKLVDSQRAKIEMETLVRRGELIEIGRVYASGVTVATGTKNALMGLLQDLPPTLEGLTAAQILPILRGRFIDVLTRLSDGEFFTEANEAAPTKPSVI